jgi:hypothetical protein
MDPGSMDGDQGTHQAEYLSYLLRLWRVTVEGAPVWRVSLQRPGAAEQTAFAGLDELLTFLRTETGERNKGQTAETEAPMG